jgi:hypothetical protein
MNEKYAELPLNSTELAWKSLRTDTSQDILANFIVTLLYTQRKLLEKFQSL